MMQAQKDKQSAGGGGGSKGRRKITDGRINENGRFLLTNQDGFYLDGQCC